MPGARPSNTLKGDRAEYLAQYLLSFIGLPLPVLRQQDIGIDFFCNISESSGKINTYSHPFSLQLKVLNETTGLLSSPICFGGLSQKGNWKKYEIDWLFNQEIPFFIGILDSINKELYIYTTSAIWFTYHLSTSPTEIILIPRIKSDNSKEVHLPNAIAYNKNIDSEQGDGHSHHIDLGQPIVTLKLNQADDASHINQQKVQLKGIIEMSEHRNLIHRKIKSPFFWWNKFQNSGNLAWYVNPWSPILDINKVVDEVVPMILVLALYYKNENLTESLQNLVPFLKSIREKIPEEIKSGPLKELFDTKDL